MLKIKFVYVKDQEKIKFVFEKEEPNILIGFRGGNLAQNFGGILV